MENTVPVVDMTLAGSEVEERDAVTTQWDSGAEFSLTRGSGLTCTEAGGSMATVGPVGVIDGSEAQVVDVTVVSSNLVARRWLVFVQGQSAPINSGSDTESLAASDSGDDDGSEVSGEEDDIELPVVEPVAPVVPSAAAQRGGFTQLDQWNLDDLSSRRASVMKTVPRFLWGSFRIALKVAMEEIVGGAVRRNEIQPERGWKLFWLLPRMMLHRSPRGGLIGREKLMARFDNFAAGQWHDLIVSSNRCAEGAATVWRRRARRVQSNQEEKRATRAFNLIQMGELSAGRHALEGAELAPCNDNTLTELRKRASRPREVVPPVPPDVPVFNLDEKIFIRNVRSARRGAAGGLSGMTSDHLRPVLESSRDLHTLFKVAESMSPWRYALLHSNMHCPPGLGANALFMCCSH